jgi:hypothetical protein
VLSRCSISTEIPFIVLSKRLYSEKGLEGFFVGLSARLIHVGTIITSQLVVYNTHIYKICHEYNAYFFDVTFSRSIMCQFTNSSPDNIIPSVNAFMGKIENGSSSCTASSSMPKKKKEIKVDVGIRPI